MCNSVRNIGQDNYFNEKKTSYIVHKSPTKVKVVTLFADIGQIGICYHGAKCIFFEMCIKCTAPTMQLYSAIYAFF